MKAIEMSKKEARKVLISYHGLNEDKTLVGEEGILDFFNQVGCIQYDPLNVVGRNPDLVLQSRINGYNVNMLEKLLYQERSLMDGWDKMMAIYKKEDWPFFQRIREKNNQEMKRILKNRNSLNALNLTEEITGIIKKEGPLPASKISSKKGGKGVWGHKKLSSAALDYMFHKGDLGIYGKINTQKIYELIEKLVPKEILESPDPFKNDHDFYKWYITRRIGSVGLLWGKNGGGWLGHFISDKKLRNPILLELEEEKTITPIKIEGIKDVFYMRQEDLRILESIGLKKERKVKFLAPLDNLLWDRGMIEAIFDFKYSWEVYVPVSKRKYGYYVLPILYGEQFIGRFEPEMHRGQDPLRIKNWWWEENTIQTEDMKQSIGKGLENFCEYLQADGVYNKNFIK